MDGRDDSTRGGGFDNATYRELALRITIENMDDRSNPLKFPALESSDKELLEELLC